MEVGDHVRIIYDDKGKKPVQKIGKVVWKESPLFKLDSNPESLNLNNVIRSVPIVEGGLNEGKQKR